MRIIAHRGGDRKFPENSLAVFEHSMRMGFDAIEIDLLITKDKRLVARHDNLIQKGERWFYIHELSLHELKEIDIGRDERIPALEEVFDLLYGRCPIVLDLKGVGIAPFLVDFLIKRKAEKDVQVSSFLRSEIAEVGSSIPDIERSIVLITLPPKFEGLFREMGIHQVSLHRAYVTEAQVRSLKTKKIRVQVYPVDVLREVLVFSSWGVDAIYTGDPTIITSLRKKEVLPGTMSQGDKLEA